MKDWNRRKIKINSMNQLVNQLWPFNGKQWELWKTKLMHCLINDNFVEIKRINLQLFLSTQCCKNQKLINDFFN